MAIATDYRVIMAQDLGYMLAISARWRRVNVGSDMFILQHPYFANGLFRPQPRIIRSLDMKSRTRGQNIVRFAERRGEHWSLRRNLRIKHECRDTSQDLEQRNTAHQCAASIRDRDNISVSAGPVKRILKRPGYPDPVELTQQFVDKLSKKLLVVSPEMILCTDDVTYMHELIAAGDRRRLQFLLHKFHFHHVLLPWPTGWVFTVIDATRSPRLQKASAAVLRDGYLCCDKVVIPIGVVHDVGREPADAEHPVIIITLEGYVYMYDDGGVVPVLYLLTKQGFSDFCRRGLRERCGAGLDLKSTPVNYDEEPLRSLLSCRSSIDDLVDARNRLLGSEAVIFHTDDMWTFIRISDLSNMGYDKEDFETWKLESGHLRLEVIFTIKAYISGAWVDSPVLVSDVGTVFYVEPGNNRLRFLATDLYNFLVLGVMRFRSNSCFPRGTFSASSRRSPIISLYGRPIFCPRGHLCKRNTESTLSARIWRRFCNMWGCMLNCCRTQ